MADIEGSLARLIDEAAVRDAIARFAEAASFKQYDAFHALWSADCLWSIGAPYEARTEGPDAAVALLRKLRDPKEFFVQFAHPGVVRIDGDEARARCIVHEEGRGPGETGFRCHSMTDDVLRRSADGWVFVRRAFQYIWLDTEYFPGDVFEVKLGAPLPRP